jgi:prefoldin beta subunit
MVSLGQFEEAVKKLRGMQKQMQENLRQREQLFGQRSENEQVAAELALVGAADDVFKLVGPVLVRQPLDEAKDTVKKRLDFITSEIIARETKLKELEQQAQAQQAAVSKKTNNKLSHPFRL